MLFRKNKLILLINLYASVYISIDELLFMYNNSIRFNIIKIKIGNLSLHFN